MAGKVSSRVSELGIPQSQRMTLEGHDDLPGPHLWHPRWFTGHWRLRCLLQLKANDSKWWIHATKLQCTTAGSGETKALVFWRSDLVGTKQKPAMADSAQQWICHDVSFKIAKTNRDQTNDVKPSNRQTTTRVYMTAPWNFIWLWIYWQVAGSRSPVGPTLDYWYLCGT